MRAESAAASTNSVLILALVWLLLRRNPAGGAVVYANPAKHVFQTLAMAAILGTPLAVFAFWRTWVHAQRLIARRTTGWQGVLEAGAFGFASTLPFVLPGVVARQFDPGEWGQPQAFVLGLAYMGAYGLIGLLTGLALGLLLWISASAALLVHRRFTPS